MKSDPLEWTAGELLHALENRVISATEYASCLVNRAQRLEGLHAFISFDPDAVIEAALTSDALREAGTAAPLCGVPVAVKDNIAVTGMPLTGGTAALRAHRPEATSPVVARLLDKGAYVVGKTNLHELACGATTRNGTYGHARTPYDTTRSAGGSSGGTAAALAARLSPLGLGTDTGASVRNPSSFCGTAALRPTVGAAPAGRRYPIEGVLPISTTRDTIGPMARTVRDVALLDAAIVGSHAPSAASLKGLRVALPLAPYWLDLAPEVERVAQEAIQALTAAGVVFVPTDLLGAVNDLNGQAAIADLWEFRHALPDFLRRSGSDRGWDDLRREVASPDIAIMMDMASSVTDEQHREALDLWRPKLIAAYDELFRATGACAYLIPTVPVLPPLAVAVSPDGAGPEAGAQLLDEFTVLIRNLYASAGAGLPGVAFPAGLTTGRLPVGIEIDGPRGADEALLAIGVAMEDVLGVLPSPDLIGMLQG